MQVVQSTDVGAAQGEDPVMEGDNGLGQNVRINHTGSDVDDGIQLS